MADTLTSDEQTTAARSQQEKSSVQVRLLKGPIYRAQHKELWAWLERDQYRIREYFQQIGLALTLDDSEGYAFLRQQELSAEQGDIDIPRLIRKYQLPFNQTLLLVLLRKRLAEHDSEDSTPRLIIDRQSIYQAMSGFYPDVSDQVKQQKEFDAVINKVKEMGFLTLLPNHKDEFEVQRIIKAVISAERIGELIDTLTSHQQHNEEED
ncbi:DUF4194 domain-containing protein [Thalassotalea euphylliae]|uniref:DUF4194 domain-containing protein n=1 Tax=Thalassotalea euphylliae TaxID=1655234 RepID=A0A3E0TLG7_9GAMM|nr:DUF4194 domain-containing protein [Thalassotalea euphylliae]REL25366.1 DUF4194 domain-containing protein [Thalassotalea euphylliae]